MMGGKHDDVIQFREDPEDSPSLVGNGEASRVQVLHRCWRAGEQLKPAEHDLLLTHADGTIGACDNRWR